MKYRTRHIIVRLLIAATIAVFSVSSADPVVLTDNFPEFSTLAVPSFHQKGIPLDAERLQRDNVHFEKQLMMVSFAIADHFIREKKDIRTLPRSVRDNLRNIPWALKFIRDHKIDLEASSYEQSDYGVRFEDGVVSIRYSKAGRLREMQVCALGTIDPGDGAWRSTDRFAVKDIEVDPGAYDAGDGRSNDQKTVQLSFSILGADPSQLESEVDKIIACGLDSLHVDYFDGASTFGDRVDPSGSIRKISDRSIPIYVHLWANEPGKALIDKLIDAGLKGGRDKIILSYESFSDITDLIALVLYIKQRDLNVGLSLNPGTDISVLDRLWNCFDNKMKTVVVMGVVPGPAGQQSFIPETLDKIRSLRKMIVSKNKDIEIEADGGINAKTYKDLLIAGADTLSCRSLYLKSSNLKERARSIKEYAAALVSIRERGEIVDILESFSFSVVAVVESEGELFVRKQALFSGENELIPEIRWIRRLPDEIKQFFPAMLGHSLERGNVFYEMPYYAETTDLMKQIRTRGLSSQKVNDILERILRSYLKQFSLRQGKVKADPGYLRKTVVEKTDRRLNEVKRRDASFGGLLDPEYLTINGRKCKNIPALFSEMEHDGELLEQLNPRYLHFIHGDLSFQNILTSGNTFLYVDPAGKNSGDLVYDLSKLSQTIFGKLDLIERGAFNLSIDGEIVDFSIKQTDPCWRVYKELEEGFDSVLNNTGVSDYLSENDPYWRLRLQLTTALNFAGYMLFRLNDEEKAKAFYVQSVIMINDFLERYNSLSEFGKRLIKERAVKDAEGKRVTLPAICPMSESIIRSFLEVAKEDGTIPVFISTPRQVDVEGSYTGWTQEDYVKIVRDTADEIGYEGSIYLERDHGGPWQRPQDKELSLQEAMKNAKRTYRADLDAGYNILHIDVTMFEGEKDKKLEIGDMIDRTVELIEHCEEYRLKKNIPPVAYEIGSDENQRSLKSNDDITRYVKALRERLVQKELEYVWDNIVYLVIDTGARISGKGQIGTLESERIVRIFKIASSFGLYLKQHNSDFMEEDQLKILPLAGIAAANIGPEVSKAEYEALDELEKEIARRDPEFEPFFMELVAEELEHVGRWRHWFKEYENIYDLNEDDKREVLLNCGRYVQDYESIKTARLRLYKEANAQGIEFPERFINERIKERIRFITGALVAPAGVNINVNRAVDAVLESDALAFDIDRTITRERRESMTEGVATGMLKFCKGGIESRKKIRIVTGRPLSKVRDNGTLEPFLGKLREMNIDVDLVVYVSEGAGKYAVTNNGEFIPFEEYNKPFTTFEANRIMEVLRRLSARIGEEQGVESQVDKAGDIRFEWRAYGSDNTEYYFETNPGIQYEVPRKTRFELGTLALAELVGNGVEDVDFIVSGGTTIGFVRKGVSKKRAILDIIHEDGTVTYFGDEVGSVIDVSGNEKVGNDNSVGRMIGDGVKGLQVVALDEVPTGVPEGVIWIGGGVEGTTNILEHAHYVRGRSLKRMQDMQFLLEQYDITDETLLSVTELEKGKGIHDPFYKVRSGKGNYILRHVNPNVFDGDSLEAVRYEIWVVNSLKNAGIPVVPVVEKSKLEGWEEKPEDRYICRDENGKFFILYENMEENRFDGIEVSSFSAVTDQKYESMIDMIADIHKIFLASYCPYERERLAGNMLDIRKLTKKLRRMHDIVREKKYKQRRPVTRGERFVLENSGFVADQIDEMCKNLGYYYGRQDMRRIPIHGDFTPTNNIFREDEIAGIIDWEYSRVDIMIFDLAAMLRQGLPGGKYDFSINNIRRLVFGYNELNPLTESEIRALPEVFRYKLVDRLSRMATPWRYFEGMDFDFQGASEEEKTALLIDKNDALYEWHVSLVDALWNFTALIEDGSFEREIVRPLLMRNGIIDGDEEREAAPEKLSGEVINETLEGLKEKSPFSISMRRTLGDISFKELIDDARPADEVCRENNKIWAREGNYYDNGWLKIMSDFEIIFQHKYAVIYRVPTGNIYVAIRGKDDQRVADNKDMAVIEVVLNSDYTVAKIAVKHPVSEYDMSRSSMAIQLTEAEVFDKYSMLGEALRYQLVWQEVDGESRFREVMDDRTIELGSLVERAIKDPSVMSEKDISSIMSLRYIKSKVIRMRALTALGILYDAGKIPEEVFKNAVRDLIDQNIEEGYRVIERAIKYDADFIKDTFKNIYGEDAETDDISSVDIMYFDQAEEKDIYKVIFNLTENRGARVAIISVIRQDEINISLSQDAINTSTRAWREICDHGIGTVAKLGAMYWELDYRARMVNFAIDPGKGKKEEPLVNNIQVISREYIEGETLSEILSNKHMSESEKKKAIASCREESERFFLQTMETTGKGYFIEDPRPSNFMLYKVDGKYVVRLMDLDRLVEFPNMVMLRKVINKFMPRVVNMRTVFVNMADRNAEEVRPPLAISSLTSAAKKSFGDDINIDVVDLGLKHDGFDMGKYVGERNANIVCISIPASSLFEHALEVAEQIKDANPDVFVVAGGIHPTVDPAGVMAYDCFDALVKGEGEKVLVEFLGTFLSGGDWMHIGGLMYRDESGGIVDTGPAETIELDDLPKDIFSEIDLSEYDLGLNEFGGEKFLPVTASRGCPYKCRFCSYTAVAGKTRFKTPERMVSEIEGYVEKYGIHNFFFYDDTFTLNRDFVRNFCNMVIDRGLNIRWRCFTRADRVDEDLLLLMRNAGCSHIAFGLECADEEVLNKIDKKAALQEYRDACSLAKKAGIRVKLFLLFGLPGQTAQSVDKTIDFLREVSPEEIDAQFFVPYPGSEFAAYPGEWGITILDPAYTGFRQREQRRGGEEVHPVVETQWMKRSDIEAARKRTLEEFEKIRSGNVNFEIPREGIVEVLEKTPLYSVILLNRGGKLYVRKQAWPTGEMLVTKEIRQVEKLPGDLKGLISVSERPGYTYYEMPHDMDSWGRGQVLIAENLEKEERSRISSEQADLNKQRSVMSELHELNMDLIPPVPDGRTVYYVLPESIIPGEDSLASADFDQRSSFRDVFARLRRDYSGNREKIIMVPDDKMDNVEDVAVLIERIREYEHEVSGREVEMNFALTSEKQLDLIPESAKALIFEAEGGNIGSIRQIEGIIAALRTLHIADIKERNNRLSVIYRLLTEKDPPEVFPGDLRELARVVKFVLPPVLILDSDGLKELNDQMQIFIEFA
ncbi:MAG: radical SAM protein [Candidatus Omnitrophota bacterium]